MSTAAHNPNQALDEIAAQIVALTGCADDVARIAAGSYLAFGNDPRHGLGDAPAGKGSLFAKAETALNAWLASPALLMAAE